MLVTYRDDAVMRRCANIVVKEATHIWVAEETEFTLTKLMNRTQYFDGRKHQNKEILGASPKNP